MPFIDLIKHSFASFKKGIVVREVCDCEQPPLEATDLVLNKYKSGHISQLV